MQARECWSVAFGDAHSAEDRCVLAGYDSGDLKLFDLRAGRVRWETSLGNGVCGVQFDRRGIAQNKFAAACLESRYHVFDARTLHPDQVMPKAASARDLARGIAQLASFSPACEAQVASWMPARCTLTR